MNSSQPMGPMTRRPASAQPASRFVVRAACAAALSLAALSLLPATARGADTASAAASQSSQSTAHTRIAGAYRIELHVLPPEPFYTAAQVATRNVKRGMLVTGGAEPSAPTDIPRPNHHLIVRVFDRNSGQVVTDAKVSIHFRRLDGAGQPKGATVTLPVVVMQEIGAGPASTRYGNNVAMPGGSYTVSVTVNGKTVTFPIKVSDLI